LIEHLVLSPRWIAQRSARIVGSLDAHYFDPAIYWFIPERFGHDSASVGFGKRRDHGG